MRQIRQQEIPAATASLVAYRTQTQWIADKQPDFIEAIGEYEPPVRYSPDIPLSAELQDHIRKTCIEYSVPEYQVLNIMWNESRFLPVGAEMDTNGLLSAGRMQINQGKDNAIWNKYAALGLDVYDEFDNITIGIMMLAELREKYGEELAIVAYQCGEYKMKINNITSTEFSRWVIGGEGAWLNS